MQRIGITRPLKKTFVKWPLLRSARKYGKRSAHDMQAWDGTALLTFTQHKTSRCMNGTRGSARELSKPLKVQISKSIGSTSIRKGTTCCILQHRRALGHLYSFGPILCLLALTVK